MGWQERFIRARRNRQKSEAELTLQQMMQTVLIEGGLHTSGALFAYNKGGFSKGSDGPQEPVITARSGTFTASPAGLSITSAGRITPSTSTIGEYEVTITIPPSATLGPDFLKNGGTYTQTIKIVA